MDLETLVKQKDELNEKIDEIELKLVSAKKKERDQLLEELDVLEEKKSELKILIKKFKSGESVPLPAEKKVEARKGKKKERKHCKSGYTDT